MGTFEHETKGLYAAREMLAQVHKICLQAGQQLEIQQCRYDRKSESWKKSNHGRFKARNLLRMRKLLHTVETA